MSTKFGKEVLISISILLTHIIITGCVSPPPTITNNQTPTDVNKTLDLTPVIDYNPLEGFTGEGAEGLYVISGDLPAVKEELQSLVRRDTTQQKTFSVNEDLNIVVFRGVFNTGGYGIEIDEVKITDHLFTVTAIYTDPGPGMAVTQAFTHPTAIIQIGNLEKGTYSAKLQVILTRFDKKGNPITQVEEKRASIEFKIE
jgi:hypothetical protein